MPEPQGEELERVRARREELRKRYLRPLADRPGSTVSGVHHLALIAKDTEETIKFYQEFLGFPMVELVENRDYAGSNHFFFDLGNRNLLGFFDFPGLDSPDWVETIGAVQHLAISIASEQFETAKRKLDEAGIDYLGPDRGANDSLYFRDPNGVGIELYREKLGWFEGIHLVGAD
jgi:glyoxylase I family protein